MIDLTPEPGQPRDTRLIERAVRQRWNIPEQYRDGIVKRQIAIAMDLKSSNREATSAAKCLKDMDALNMAQEEREAPQVRRHEVLTVNIELTAEEREKHRQAALEALTAKLMGTNGHTNGHSELPGRPE